MKKLFGVYGLLLLISLSFVRCITDDDNHAANIAPGTYINKSDTSTSITYKNDGTYLKTELDESADVFTENQQKGKYLVVGDSLKLSNIQEAAGCSVTTHICQAAFGIPQDSVTSVSNKIQNINATSYELVIKEETLLDTIKYTKK